MFCNKCGAQVAEGISHCPQCGNSVAQTNNGKTLGIVGLILGLFFPMVGWICCGIGLSRANAVNDSQSRTINIVGIVLATLSFLATFIFYMTAGSQIMGDLMGSF